MRHGVRAINACWQAALLWSLPAGLALAAAQQDSLQYQQAAPLALPSTGGMLLRMALSLVIVIGLVLVLVKLLQRNTMLSRQSSWARVVDQVAVGQNRMLVLAEIFGKVYVLGVTEHNITALLGENEIDLSQFRQVMADMERKRVLPSYFNKTFLQVLETKIQNLKKNYPGAGKDDRSR